MVFAGEEPCLFRFFVNPSILVHPLISFPIHRSNRYPASFSPSFVVSVLTRSVLGLPFCTLFLSAPCQFYLLTKPCPFFLFLFHADSTSQRPLSLTLNKPFTHTPHIHNSAFISTLTTNQLLSHIVLKQIISLQWSHHTTNGRSTFMLSSLSCNRSLMTGEATPVWSALSWVSAF